MRFLRTLLSIGIVIMGAYLALSLFLWFMIVALIAGPAVYLYWRWKWQKHFCPRKDSYIDASHS